MGCYLCGANCYLSIFLNEWAQQQSRQYLNLAFSVLNIITNNQRGYTPENMTYILNSKTYMYNSGQCYVKSKMNNGNF